MTSKKKAKRRVVGTALGVNLIVIAGLPVTTYRTVMNRLDRDTSHRVSRFIGMPSPPNDWQSLYKSKTRRSILESIEREFRRIKPQRIIALYVPSVDSPKITCELDPVCFLAPLNLENGIEENGNSIKWRHQRNNTERIVYRTLEKALEMTDHLKKEITDKRISPLSLPSKNFFYPDGNSTISTIYRRLVGQSYDIQQLKDVPLPIRFTREQLSHRVFSTGQFKSRFFKDCRGRVFALDIGGHAPNRIEGKDNTSTGLSLSLRQRYRFGVTVRDGNLHYDVQFEHPRQLASEPMYCADRGDVLITGTHANVGVNDVIWAPSGTIVTKQQIK